MIRHVLLCTALLVMIAACGSRFPQYEGAESNAVVDPETSAQIQQSLSIWCDQLSDYLNASGEGWSSRLNQLRDLRGNYVQRPERIRFSVLAPSDDRRDAYAWDVRGLFLGRSTVGHEHWYVFVVGVIERDRYRPVTIRDIRLVALAKARAGARCQQGPPNGVSLESYRSAYGHQSPIRFPAENDRYRFELQGEQVQVREILSKAEWTLQPGAIR